MANKLFLIGINSYKHHDNLAGCVRDITDFKNVLLEKYDFKSEDVYEIIDENANSKNIQDALKGYGKSLSSDDNLIIYYSGHGEYDEELDIGYWVPHEADVYTQYIQNSNIITFLSRINCKHIILISDSCFSNSIFREGRFKKVDEYFEKSSRWALTSAFYEAKDSDEISNTLFAECIIDCLKETEKDIRFSEIIEKVKARFEINLFQSPQGAPLNLEDHHGGEFIFKITKTYDSRNLKGYVDFIKILNFYKRNSIFKEVAIFEDKSKKIGYQLFSEFDSVLDTSTYYLYLYEGINQTQTYSDLKNKHGEIFSGKTVIFIPIEKDQKNIELRKNNIKEKFKPISLFYIDEFIREHCTPKVIQDESEKYLNIKNFITPEIHIGDETTSLKLYFEKWHKQIDEPILVVKGSGGIGKTTLAYYFADRLIEFTPSNYVLFIDSSLIKDSLIKNKNRENLNLYNFYEALFDITDNIHEKLSEDLFQLNVDAGNILIIIDGLDEIISKVPNFDTTKFLESIKLSSSDLGNGKVIITCRSYFWDSSGFSGKTFPVIELEPFTESQSKEFFKKSFENDTIKLGNAVRLANGFKFPEGENKNIYHPYVLDIIRSIIESDNNLVDFDLSEVESSYLCKGISNDYITYRICDREIKRVGQVSVDDQINIFIYMSVNRGGLIMADNLHSEVTKALGRTVDNTNVEAFKSHPFLMCKDNVIKFKYDFLLDLFKAIYVSIFLKYDNDSETITDELLEIINDSCWYGAPINSDIPKRIASWNEDNFLLVSDFITQIKNKLNTIKSRKTIANIFNLCLQINHKFYPNDIENNTNLIRSLFEIKNGQLDGVSIIDLNGDKSIKFNFESVTISNSNIDNFGNFWKCKFDTSTRFIKSELVNLNEKVSSSILGKDNFIDCIFDSGLTSAIETIDRNKGNRKAKIRIFVHDFFHLFVSNGKLGRQWEHKVIAPRFNGINKCNLNYKKVVNIFKSNGVLVITDELGKRKFTINDDSKADVNNYLNDGTPSNSITRIIKDLL
ncbi:caspase family protein [Vibrio penaeicida]|uniref:caspase family protein n=1 Tax=Vibrio penaeicida TaxID=104609 RepID=UPI002734A340|nr:caspase family protein [Vibrio penaeicida]MDP2574192.1 caspase family protein [Vibrio penaeicida]